MEEYDEENIKRVRPPNLDYVFEQVPFDKNHIADWVEAVVEKGLASELVKGLASIQKYQKEVVKALLEQEKGEELAQFLSNAELADPFDTCMELIANGDFDTIKAILHNFGSYIYEKDREPIFSKKEAERIYKALYKKCYELEAEFNADFDVSHRGTSTYGFLPPADEARTLEELLARAQLYISYAYSNKKP